MIVVISLIFVVLVTLALVIVGETEEGVLIRIRALFVAFQCAPEV
ncbi:hypothetical protein PI124_g10696 [Phytophthora idaei]|nr:hypothetical protein PI124_g10696 [Phytophthora idaei]